MKSKVDTPKYFQSIFQSVEIYMSSIFKIIIKYNNILLLGQTLRNIKTVFQYNIQLERILWKYSKSPFPLWTYQPFRDLFGQVFDFEKIQNIVLVTKFIRKY